MAAIKPDTPASRDPLCRRKDTGIEPFCRPGDPCKMKKLLAPGGDQRLSFLVGRHFLLQKKGSLLHRGDPADPLILAARVCRSMAILLFHAAVLPCYAAVLFCRAAVCSRPGPLSDQPVIGGPAPCTGLPDIIGRLPGIRVGSIDHIGQPIILHPPGHRLLIHTPRVNGQKGTFSQKSPPILCGHRHQGRDPARRAGLCQQTSFRSASEYAKLSIHPAAPHCPSDRNSPDPLDRYGIQSTYPSTHRPRSHRVRSHGASRPARGIHVPSTQKKTDIRRTTFCSRGTRIFSGCPGI